MGGDEKSEQATIKTSSANKGTITRKYRTGDCIEVFSVHDRPAQTKREPTGDGSNNFGVISRKMNLTYRKNPV
jgi:hypothetical protein